MDLIRGLGMGVWESGRVGMLGQEQSTSRLQKQLASFHLIYMIESEGSLPKWVVEEAQV